MKMSLIKFPFDLIDYLYFNVPMPIAIISRHIFLNNVVTKVFRDAKIAIESPLFVLH